MSKLSPSGIVFALASLSAPAFAQTEAPPAYVAVLDGDVTLVRDSQAAGTVVAVVNMPIVPGDRLTTTAGRVEVLYPDGTALDLDEGANAEFGVGGGVERIRLSSGRAILVVPAGRNAARYELDTPAGAVITRGPGKYRADAAGSSTWALSARGNTNDGFEGWSDALRAARTSSNASPSAEHLPEELQPYDATLDQNGTWQYAATYGYVWYPRVENDWRPYYEGTWTSVPSYGWTWVGVHRWEYPTHHYGRWGYANNRWFWIPGRAYAPAWVAWGYANDYVSWCPLGIDSRPVFAMTVGYGNPWVGWTVLSKTHFGGRGYVPRLAVPPHQISTQTPFVVQRTAPAIAPRVDNAFPSVNAGPGVAVPRGTRTQPPAATSGSVGAPRGVPPAPAAAAPPSPDAVAVPRNPNTTPTQVVPGSRRRSSDDPYRPNYAPAQPTTPAAPAQTTAPGKPAPPTNGRESTPPPSSTPPPAQTATPRTAPTSGGGGGTAPRSAPPASTPPASAAPAPHSSGSGASSQKPAPAQKPADNGKARGRGGR